MELLLLNDNLLYLLLLQNEHTDAYVNNATVTAQVKDMAGTNVGTSLTLTALGSLTPVTLRGKTYADGNYFTTIEEDIAISAGDYEIWVDADAGSDLKGHWEVPVKAIKRRA